MDDDRKRKNDNFLQLGLPQRSKSRPGKKKDIKIPPPFPWSKDERAKVLNREELLSRNIRTITGEVQCKHCEKIYEHEYDLNSKFEEIATYIIKNNHDLHNRAPRQWMHPAFPTCKFCNQINSAKPRLSPKKRNINWLFLFLGQLLGCCVLGQLKYFCEHTKNHRTGAKDRLLYLTYLEICKQLDPINGPFFI